MFELLSNDEKATMLMNLFNHQEGLDPVLDTSGLKMAWASMKFLIEKDGAEYEKAVQRAKNAAQAKTLSAQAKALPAPVLNNLNRVDNDNVNVNVNDKGNENGGDNKGETHVTHVTPSKTLDSHITESQRKEIEFEKVFGH